MFSRALKITIMNVKRSVLFLLLPLCLASCGEKVEFPVTDDPDLIYLLRNGDSLQSKATTVNELSIRTNTTDLIKRLEANEPMFVYSHTVFCPACKAAEGAMVTFLKDSQVQMLSLYNESRDDRTIIDTVEALRYDYPEVYKAFLHSDGGLYTPAAVLIKDKEHAYQVSFEENRANANALEKQFRDLMNLTAVYNFRHLDSFLSYIEKTDCLFFFETEIKVEEKTVSAFTHHVYDKAIHQSKPVAVLHYASLTADEKATLSARLANGESTLCGTFTGGKASVLNYQKSPDQVPELLTTYYGA